MLRKWIAVLIIIAYSLIGNTQVKFYAESNAREVVEGGTFQLTFSIENAEPTSLPQFKLNKNKFKIAGGPSTSSNISIYNGRKSTKKSYAYTIQTRSLGTNQIPSATIKAGGKTYTSKPLVVKTVKGKPGVKSVGAGVTVADGDIFVNIEVSDSSAYVGQQVTLKYVLYSNKDVKTYDIKNESSYDGFYVSKVNNYRDRAVNVVIDGKQYKKQSLKTIILFPQQSGSYTIDPTTIDLGLPDPKRQQRGFFFSSRTIPFRTVTKPLTIEVKSSPPNAPVSFSGAIGRYNMTAKVDKRMLTTDDAVTMVMTVKGVGDGKFIEAAIQPEHKAFDYYDPNTLSDDSYERGDEIMVSKSFEYLIVPKKTGTFFLKPEFTYFDIDSSKYITLYSNQYRIQVNQGTGVSKEEFQRDDLAEFNGLMETTSLGNKGGRFMFSPLYWGMMLLPLLGFAGVYVQKCKQVAIESIDPLVAQQTAAKRVALSKLTSAKEAMSANKHRTFYEEINKGLYGYMSDRLFVPASDLNRSNIEEKLISKNITVAVKEKFISIINTCQQAMYAGKTEASLNSIYDDAVDVIMNLEDELGKKSE